jgi:transposase InsO family protein
MSRFMCPTKIITDNAVDFKSKKIEKICSDYNITLGNSKSYYPQGNGLVESSNKSLVRIIPFPDRLWYRDNISYYIRFSSDEFVLGERCRNRRHLEKKG